MPEPVYPAARAVAATMERYFRRYLEAEGQADRAELVPDAAAIEQLVNAAFWASLRREEGLHPADLARVSASRSHRLTPDVRTAADARRSHAREAGAGGRTSWDSSRRRARTASFACGARPADSRRSRSCSRLSIRAARRQAPPDRSGEVHQRARDRRGSDQDRRRTGVDPARLPAGATSLIGFHPPASRLEGVNVLVELAVSMRAHQPRRLAARRPRQAAMPGGSRSCTPVAYPVVPPFAELAL